MDLTGQVTLPAGNSSTATVLVTFAQTKLGLAVGASDQYPKLPRRVQADRLGHFKIEALNPDWLCCVVMIAPHCQPRRLYQVDVAAGPLNSSLEAVNASQVRPGAVLRGVVKDAGGKPVSGAVVTMQEVTRNNIWEFRASQIDEFAVTDGTGHFVVYGQTDFTDAGGAVEATGFATQLFEHWPPGDVVHEMKLGEGAIFEGRLLAGGAPVANAEVRLDNFGAEAGSSIWNYTDLTDDQGRFSFAHLPPNRRFALYATMKSLGDRGALSKLAGRVHTAGSTNNIGDVSLAPAYQVQGRIVLSDGKPVPVNSRLTLSRTSMAGLQDELSSALGPDGAFRFVGVPAEKATVYLRVPGYEISPAGQMLKSGSATNLVVAGNITNMVIRLQPQARN